MVSIDIMATTVISFVGDSKNKRQSSTVIHTITTWDLV